MDKATPEPPRPWWREPMLWLVLGGPAAVVAACIVTVAIAIARPDPVLSATGQAADEPAVQARNHAATR